MATFHRYHDRLENVTGVARGRRRTGPSSWSTRERRDGRPVMVAPLEHLLFGQGAYLA